MAGFFNQSDRVVVTPGAVRCNMRRRLSRQSRTIQSPSTMQRSFSHLLTVSLSLAASVIALVFGVLVYFYEIERIDEAAVDLVTLEARTFAELPPTALASTERIEERLKASLAEREGGADGHFVLAEVYDADSRTLAEASLDDVAKVEAGFNRNAHPFQGNRIWSLRLLKAGGASWGSGVINSDQGCRNGEEPASVRSFARSKGSSPSNHLPNFSYAIALPQVSPHLPFF